MTDAPASKTSPWGKITAIGVAIIAVVMVGNLFVENREANCAEQAVTAGTDLLFTIQDTRWTLKGCEYLLKSKYADGQTWQPQSAFDQIYTGET